MQGQRSTTKTTLRSERRSTLKKYLTGPTLLEMSGNRCRLRGRRNTIWYKAVFKGGVYETREAVWGFGGAETRRVASLEGWADTEGDRAPLDGLHALSCWAKEQYQSQAMPTRIVCFLLVLISASGFSGADFSMKVTDKNYLDTQGFSVFLYDSTYHPVFVDQKNTAMEMILHGQRIATNGDVRLMPTPEQWDLVATLKDRHVDKANHRLTADLAFPTFDFSYTLEVAAEPGGVKVSIHLDKPLPQKLEGRAGFNLEFLPSIYMGKAYMVDGTKAGFFPRTPNDAMTKVLPLADEPKKAYYLEDWDKAKGYTQPLPFAEGKSITLGVDDALARVNVVSDTANLMLFDGRDRAQNGWFVLRSLIPSGKTTAPSFGTSVRT